MGIYEDWNINIWIPAAVLNTNIRILNLNAWEQQRFRVHSRVENMRGHILFANLCNCQPPDELAAITFYNGRILKRQWQRQRERQRQTQTQRERQRQMSANVNHPMNWLQSSSNHNGRKLKKQIQTQRERQRQMCETVNLPKNKQPSYQWRQSHFTMEENEKDNDTDNHKHKDEHRMTQDKCVHLWATRCIGSHPINSCNHLSQLRKMTKTKTKTKSNTR